MRDGGYPVGLVIAPIMPYDGWRGCYAALLDDIAAALGGVDDLDLTVELTTHRFTPTSKRVLEGWYPASTLEVDEEVRTLKHTRFGARKHVYPKAVMDELRGFFEADVGERLPAARILYFT